MSCVMAIYQFKGTQSPDLSNPNKYDPVGTPGLADTIDFSTYDGVPTGHATVDRVINGTAGGSIIANSAQNILESGGSLQAGTVNGISAFNGSVSAVFSTGDVHASSGGSIDIQQTLTDSNSVVQA